MDEQIKSEQRFEMQERIYGLAICHNGGTLRKLMKLSERYTIAGSYFLKQVRRHSGKVMVLH